MLLRFGFAVLAVRVVDVVVLQDVLGRSVQSWFIASAR